MALYQPNQTFTFPVENGIVKCISHITVELRSHEALLEELNNTIPENRITHLRYRVIQDKERDNPIEVMHVSIPWDGNHHTVEVTIDAPDGYDDGHTSDDADIPKL